MLNPTVNVTITNATIQETGNDTIINMTIQTTGNMDVNATVNIRTFIISEGFKTDNETITLYANTDTNYTRTINRKGVTGVSVTYNNGTNNIEASQEFNIINKIPLDIKMSSERVTLLAILIIVIIGVIYFKRKKQVARP